MRTEDSSKNAMTSMIFYIINSIFSFISKTIFIRFLGIEYSGLNSLFTNVLGILNIAELGIGTAVGYSLYKPLAEKDTKTINEILKLYKYLYRIIAIVILIIGLIITFFLPYMINTTIDMTQIKIAYILYLISTVVSYLFTFLNVLPAADQKNYIVIKIQGIFKIVKNIIQLFAIAIFKNYYIWLIIEILGNILSYVYTNLIIKKKYQYYKEVEEIRFTDLLKKYKEIMLKVRDLFFHKIGGLVVDQTDNIVISFFCTLSDVGIYGNYMLIFRLLTGTIEQAFSSITASIGNLIVEKGKKEAFKIWKEIYSLTFFITVIFGYLFYKIVNKFITIWVGQEFMLSNVIVLAISINIMFRIIKQPIDKFKDAFGIFWDKQAPFIEAIINLIVSVILAKYIGILGVVIGTIISSTIIIGFWKPYVTFKHGFKEKFYEFIKINIPLIVISIVSLFVINLIVNFINLNIANNWIGLIITAIIYGIVTLVISLAYFMLYKPFRITFVKYMTIFKNMIFKKLKKE